MKIQKERELLKELSPIFVLGGGAREKAIDLYLEWHKYAFKASYSRLKAIAKLINVREI